MSCRTLWYRNTWSWGYATERPAAAADGRAPRPRPSIDTSAERWWYLDAEPHRPTLLFTENETNRQRLFGVPNAWPYVKDAFHEYVVGRRRRSGQSRATGTKAAAHYR